MPQSLKHEIVDPTDSKSRKRIFSYEYGSLCEIGLSIQASPRKKVAYSNEKSMVIYFNVSVNSSSNQNET